MVSAWFQHGFTNSIKVGNIFSTTEPSGSGLLA